MFRSSLQPGDWAADDDDDEVEVQLMDPSNASAAVSTASSSQPERMNAAGGAAVAAAKKKPSRWGDDDDDDASSSRKQANPWGVAAETVAKPAKGFAELQREEEQRKQAERDRRGGGGGGLRRWNNERDTGSRFGGRSEFDARGDARFDSRGGDSYRGRGPGEDQDRGRFGSGRGDSRDEWGGRREPRGGWNEGPTSRWGHGRDEREPRAAGDRWGSRDDRRDDQPGPGRMQRRMSPNGPRGPDQDEQRQQGWRSSSRERHRGETEEDKEPQGKDNAAEETAKGEDPNAPREEERDDRRRFDRGDRRGGRGSFDRDGSRGRGGGGRGFRDDGDDRGFGREGRFNRGDSGRFGQRNPREREEPVFERGFVKDIGANFGFVSCMDREGDLFFHITEAPADLETHDEVEFEVRQNRRSEKMMACRLVVLPKGTIVVETISEDFVDGVVTKGLPRGSSDSYSRKRTQEYGLIEVATGEDKKETIRFTSESLQASEKADEGAKEEEEEGQEAKPSKAKPRRPMVPRLHDEVRLRVATHRKTGVKRAVDLSVTVSYREKKAKELEEKLKNLEKQQGVVVRMGSMSGFVKVIDAKDEEFADEDIHFPLNQIGKGEKHLRQGDEVSFYVLNEADEDNAEEASGATTSKTLRFTAVRIQRLPAGTIQLFETLECDVQGTVVKAPRQSRGSSSVAGLIKRATPQTVPTTEVGEEGEQDEPKPLETKSKKMRKEASGDSCSFHLDDITVPNYTPFVGDQVLFDVIYNKATKEIRFRNIRLVELAADDRVTGVIKALKEDFGFIKCADRPCDAYFRFMDVIGATADELRTGQEVSFGVSSRPSRDGGGDNLRATRIQLLAPGKVQWETIIDPEASGKVVVAPLRKRFSTQRGSSGNSNQLTANGKIRVQLQDKLVMDFFPDLKQCFEANLIAEGTEGETQSPVSFEFPRGLQRSEIALVQRFCKAMNLEIESKGEGDIPHTTILRVTCETGRKSREEWDSLVTDAANHDVLDVEFSSNDLHDFKHDPKRKDRVTFQLGIVHRTKEFVAREIRVVHDRPEEMAEGKPADYSKLPRLEGVIREFRKENGYGFIEVITEYEQESHLFFHFKDVTQGASDSTEIQEGMEVVLSRLASEKKQKPRAVNIHIVPEGTIHYFEPTKYMGIVTKASSLARTMGKPSRDRNTKHGGSKGELVLKRRASVATPEDAFNLKFSYHLEDLDDDAEVLREGDEVEFECVKRHKASHLRLVKSCAQRGTVVSVDDKSNGVIERSVAPPENDEVPAEADEEVLLSFLRSGVLNGEILNEGDKVEFAVSRRDPKLAVDILKVSTDQSEATYRPRVINSTLLLAMRQVGANAMVSSRMAKGPDGTRGFWQGWREGKERPTELAAAGAAGTVPVDASALEQTDNEPISKSGKKPGASSNGGRFKGKRTNSSNKPKTKTWVPAGGDKPASKDSSKSSSDEPAIEKPTSDEPAIEKPTSDKPASEKPTSDKPPGDQPQES